MKVSEFSSSQNYVAHVFKKMKQGQPTWTIEKFAKRVGLGSSTLKMILSGKRQPTVHQILSIARSLRLGPIETSYLETLVLKESAKNSWESSYYSKVLQTKKKQVKLSTINASQKSLLADSLSLPLLVYLLESSDTEIDSAALAQKFDASKEKVEKLIESFRRQDILKIKPGGRFHILFDKMNHRHLQKQYLKNLLLSSAQKIDTEYENPSSLFVGYTFNTTKESLIALQMDLKKLMEKYMAEDLSQIKDRHVAQACIQVLPVTKFESSS